MIAFMAYIVSMVYYTFTKNADLVQEDYYENELNYDQDKLNRQNYQLLTDGITISQTPAGIVMHFPEIIQAAESGSVFFYRPDEKKLDRKFELQVNSDQNQVLEYSYFKTGYYDVSVEWTDGKTTYLFEDHIQF